MTRTKRTLTLAVGALFLPQLASAQACIGVPSSDGQFTLIGAAGFMDGAKSFGGGVAANLVGPISLGAGYRLVTFDDLDTNANAFNANAAYELSVPSVSICPATGIEYMRWSEDVDNVKVTITSTVIPVGVGVGRSFVAGDDFLVTLFALPHFLYVRGTVRGSEGNVSVSVSDSSNEFGSALGIRFGSRTFYAGAGVSITTIEDSDPVFSLSLGVNVGGR